MDEKEKLILENVNTKSENTMLTYEHI